MPPEQMEEIHRLAELNEVKKMSVCKESEVVSRTSIDDMKLVFGEENFPWDSWIEFREAMEEIKEIFNHREYMKRLFEPGHSGIGCQIPVFVYTFYFGESNEDSSFHWSSATATGWLEEDLGWYYERFFAGDFIRARRWYPFPAYQTLEKKVHELGEDQNAKGKRFRKYFWPKRDEEGKLFEIEPPAIKGNNEVGSIDFKEMGPFGGGFIVKDIFESLSDLVPGLGKLFERRLDAMLNQSLIRDPED
ncbi:hypothetical protein VE02_07572 [Pseudogymnoascus sp. 03VT05]|nr:hypothetical protein VE02_07572 [Pseudogymnoascus sp. 03VT05]